MARKFASAWGLGSLAAEFDTTAGAAASIQSAVSSNGSNAMKISGLASGTRSGVFKGAVSTASGGTFYHKFRFQVGTYPSAENTIWHNGTTISSFSVRMTLDGSGTLRLYWNATTLGGTATAAVPNANQWYRIELRSVSATSDAWTLFVDGTSVATQTDTAGPSGTGVFMGGNGNAETQTTGVWYFADAINQDGTGTQDNGLPGDSALFYLFPTGAGDFAEGSAGGTSPAATGWQSVSTIPPADAATFWSLVTASTSNSTADRLDVDMGSFAPSASAIHCVMVGARIAAASAASCNYILRIKSQASGLPTESGPVTIAVTAWNNHDDTANAKVYKLVQYVDPQAGGSWTTSLLNGMQIGVRSTDTTPNPQFTLLWALVEYTPSAAAPFIAPRPFSILQAVNRASTY